MDEFLDNHASDDLIRLRKALKPYFYGFQAIPWPNFRQIIDTATSKTLIDFDNQYIISVGFE